MNGTITGEALDLIVFADDCKCEFEQQVLICSVQVTHRLTSCDDTLLSRASAATYARDHRGACASCGRNSRECWKVIPVLLAAAVCGILGVAGVEALVSPKRGKK